MGYAALGDGEAIFLVDERGRSYLKRLHSGHRITIRGSVICADDIIGGPEGSLVGDPGRECFRVIRASYRDLVRNIERPAEPIFAKDAGAIIVHGDIRAGDSVIEVGVGAGTFSIALLRALGPTGTLVSYEVRSDFANVAAANVAAYQGQASNWTIKVRDGSDGFDETDVDRLVIDLPEPVPLLAAAAASLRPGGTLVVYLPTIMQVKDLHDALRRSPDFGLSETLEMFERGWHVDERSVRPDHRMVAHTGFLTFSRRIV